MSAVAREPGLRLPILERRHWAATGALATLAGLYLIAGLNLFASDGGDGRAFAGVIAHLPASGAAAERRAAPPVPEPLAFREMAPLDALVRNAAVPISSESNPAARPFLPRGSDLDQLRSLDCLTAAVYYEAAIEPTNGQRAVAQVVLNRVRHPAFPKTVCGVVFQGAERAIGCQFTFTCDGSLARVPSQAGWQRAREVARLALAGRVYKPVGYATHYHTNWVVPYWSASLTKLANVGTHIFYRWAGGWGRPGAFRYQHTGLEPAISRIRHLSDAPARQEATALAPIPLEFHNGAVTAADFKGRTVVRRYEPLRAEAAASSKAGWNGADVPRSLRWALTGEADQPPAIAPVPEAAASSNVGTTTPAPQSEQSPAG